MDIREASLACLMAWREGELFAEERALRQKLEGLAPARIKPIRDMVRCKLALVKEALAAKRKEQDAH